MGWLNWKSLTVIFIAILFGICLVHAENDLTTIPLNGIWTFRLDADNIGVEEEWFNQEFSDTIPFPGTKKMIRDIFQNYWEFQDRWNRKMPDHGQDMITVAIKTEPQKVR